MTRNTAALLALALCSSASGARAAVGDAVATVPPASSTSPARDYQVFGLRVRTGEIWLAGLSVGETYNLRVLKNLPYIIENKGEKEVDVEVFVEQPPEASLKEGYAPIPDPGWLTVLPNRFTIPYGGSSYGELILSIPNDPQWKDKHYQARIVSRTLGTGMVAAGVGTKLMFSTGAPPVTKRQRVRVPEFEFEPPVLSLFNFPVGREVDVEKEMRKALRVINKSPERFKMGFQRTDFGPVSLPGGYESAPSSVTFRLSASQLKLSPDTIGRLGLRIKLPEDAHGKRYAFLVKGELQDFPVEVLSYFTVLVRAESKRE